MVSRFIFHSDRLQVESLNKERLQERVIKSMLRHYDPMRGRSTLQGEADPVLLPRICSVARFPKVLWLRECKI
jgi:hypothetical protein